MRVLGILGSPRVGGNSDIMLDAALKAAEGAGAEIERIRLCDLDYEACRECHGCDERGECMVQDDMQNLYPLLVECDRLFLASPIFFMGLSAQTKAMIDRCQCLWVRKYRLKQTIGKGRQHRKGFFMSVGGSRNPEKFTGAATCVRAFFATLDVTYERELLVAGVDEKGAIKEHPNALSDAVKLARDTLGVR